MWLSGDDFVRDFEQYLVTKRLAVLLFRFRCWPRNDMQVFDVDGGERTSHSAKVREDTMTCKPHTDHILMVR